MAVLTREALEGSPLADLHTIAGELGLDGYRRLRKADLIDRIVEASGGEAADAPARDEDGAEDAPRRRRTRGGRGRRRTRDEDEAGPAADADADAEAEAEEDEDAREEDEDEAPARPRRSRGGRGRGRNGAAADARDDEDEAPARPRRSRGRDGGDDEPETVVEGTIEVLANGSGFLRTSPPDPSDDDVYVSAAQIRRCELVGGDVVAGPVRAPRRSERYPSLIRVDTINGRSADEVAETIPWDDLPAAHPSERFELGDGDPTLKAIEWLTPLGRGSRAVVVGAARSGKTEALRRIAGALKDDEGLELTVVLAGVRPEEVADWKAAGIEPAAVQPLGASPDAQSSVVERAIDSAKRAVVRGANAVVIVDGLDGLHPSAARRALAAARNVVDGGSLTVVASAAAPVGGETAVIALDVELTSTGRLPALDLVASGTTRPDLLVGEAGATAIAAARADALG